jgi:hypothetical protein
VYEDQEFVHSNNTSILAIHVLYTNERKSHQTNKINKKKTFKKIFEQIAESHGMN